MDKEIIIDGVDVAGCVQLVEEPFYPCGLGGECKGWKNCYYKQLKRLEQENEKFINVTNNSIIEQEKQVARINCLEQENAELKAYKDVNEDFKTAWEEFKAENEQLKTKVFKLESKQTSMGEQNKELIEDIFGLCKENEQLKEEIKTIKTSRKIWEAEALKQGCKKVVEVDKYRQTLQEIKAIVCGNYEIIDPQGRKDILKLITKAESEG